MLLSSAKFEAKAQEVISTGLASNPKHVQLEKKIGGGAGGKVVFEGPIESDGGMMLYTSGTTNRPVRCCLRKASKFGKIS